MVDFSCSFVSVCKLRKPLGGASSKLRSPHAPPKNPLRWARLAVACRTSVDEGRLTSCSPSAKARRKRLSATACPQQALCPQRGQQPVSRGRRGGARGGETAFGTPSASPPRKSTAVSWDKTIIYKEKHLTYNNTKPFSPNIIFQKKETPTW